MAAGCRKKVFAKLEDLGKTGRMAGKTIERLIGVDRCSVQPHASMQQGSSCATSDGAPFVCTHGSVDGGADAWVR